MAGFLERDGVDPYIRIRLERGTPAVDGSGTCVVGGQGHGGIAAVALEHVGDVATAQADIQAGPLEGLGPGTLELEGPGDLPRGSRHQLHQADGSGPGTRIGRKRALASRDGEQQGRIDPGTASLFFEQVAVGSREAAFQVVEVAAFPESTDGAFVPTPAVGRDRGMVELFLVALGHQVVPFFARIHDASVEVEFAGAFQCGQPSHGIVLQLNRSVVQGMRAVEPLGREEAVVAAVLGNLLEQFGAFGSAAELLQCPSLPVRTHLVVRVGVRQFLGGFQDSPPVSFVQGQAQAHVPELVVAQIRGCGIHQQVGQRQSVAGGLQGDAVAQVLDLLEAEHLGPAESLVPFVSGFGALACAARDAVRDDPAGMGTVGFQARVPEVAPGVSVDPDPEIDPGALLFRQEALEVAGQARVALLHAQLDSLPDQIIGQPVVAEPLEQGVADLGPGLAVQPDGVHQRLKLSGVSFETDMGADVQAPEADVAVFLVGIDEFCVLAALE